MISFGPIHIRSCSLNDKTEFQGLVLLLSMIVASQFGLESQAALMGPLDSFIQALSNDDMMGQSFASLVPTVAAAESAIGLAARKMLFAAILSICASSSKKISIYNEEMIVARCFIGFIIFSRKSLVPPESNEQQRLLRISLRICGTVVESLPMARSAPKYEKTVQALLCRNLNVKLATLPNATSSRRIRLQDDLVTGFHFSVSERFVPGSTLKASIVELIREGLVVLRMVRVGAEERRRIE
ncbi:ATPase subunit 4 [Tanacetum coccineum]